MLASTWFDIVVGLDVHFEIVPPALVPVPFPHAFLGLIVDPLSLTAGLALANVASMVTGDGPKGPILINGLPATTTGTEAKNAFLLPHVLIPPGTAWAPMVRAPKPAIIPGKPPSIELPVPPPGDAIIITGSKTVHALGANLCRLGDLALSCSDPIRLPTAFILTIPKGPPVLVGGPPALDWMAAGFGMMRAKWSSNALHRVVSRVKNARLRNLFHKGVCHFTGHPVDVATGRVMTDAVDFELPGPLPLVFCRDYMSSFSHRSAAVGYGWSHSLDQAVWVEPGCVVYRADDGREIEFDTFDFPVHGSRVGQKVFEPMNRLWLRSVGPNRWEIENAEGIVHCFAAIAGDSMAGLSRLIEKRSRNDHRIVLHYDQRARLASVVDSGGRIVRFAHDENGRVVKISLPHPTDPSGVTELRYVYSEEGDLVAAIDALGNATRYAYDAHLLVQETDRNVFSFYFGYDGRGTGAYCVRTWGDGGVYDHLIDYDKINRVTYVTDSLYAMTTYEMNEAYAVVKVIDSMGGVTRYEYDDHLWKTAQIDPLGNATRWEHDESGNTTRLTRADGSVISARYDERNLPLEMVDACGGRWQADYDAFRQTTTCRNPLGEVTRYEHSHGLLVAVVEASGARTALRYDSAKNVDGVLFPNGAHEQRVFDRRGRVTKYVDVRGNEQYRWYDDNDRVTTVQEPDGNVKRFSYDSVGNLLEAQDHDRHVRRHYTGYHWLAAVEEAGTRIQMRYDTEGRVLALTNEAGEQYEFIRNRAGWIREERGFDGRVTRYRHDVAGNVTRIDKPSGAWLEKSHDAAHRVTNIKRSDKSEDTFSYRADGALIAAKNESVALRFEHDALARVTKAWQGDACVESVYDATGRRSRVESSLGARIDMKHALDGSVSAVSVGSGFTPWQIEFGRDIAGDEVARKLPGGIVASLARDRFGRPMTRRVARAEHALVPDVAYRWGFSDRLVELVDALRGGTRFERDARGRLITAKHADGRVDERAMDVVSNIFRTRERKDRDYAPGGVLQRADGVLFRYDDDGNLIEKKLPNGKVWRYQWDVAGQLRTVVRPDWKRVEFDYDALGRRIRKRCDDKVIEWLWDGDVPLHELSTGEDVVTWVFEPESFAPLAKLQGDKRYGFVVDHLGAPLLLVEPTGMIGWQGQLDVFGAAKVDIARTACPWRWPGQYEDDETGLFYNRFRYYDPAVGAYISKDPIGLLGGTALYAYVDDPTGWIDPWGLISCRDGKPRPPIPTSSMKVGWDHIFWRHVPGCGNPNPGDLFRIPKGMTRGEIEKMLEEGMDEVWRVGARVTNPRQTMQVFTKRLNLGGMRAHYELVVDTGNNRIVSFYPALGSAL